MIAIVIVIRMGERMALLQPREETTYSYALWGVQVSPHRGLVGLGQPSK
jgi:hypothetical protein